MHEGCLSRIFFYSDFFRAHNFQIDIRIMHYSQRLKITQGPIDEKPQQFFINAESVLGLWYNVIGID